MGPVAGCGIQRKAYDLSIVTQPDPWTIFNYTDPNYFYQYDNPKFTEVAIKADTATSEAEFTSMRLRAGAGPADDLWQVPRISGAAGTSVFASGSSAAPRRPLFLIPARQS